jgi:hypothetical protein
VGAQPRRRRAGVPEVDRVVDAPVTDVRHAGAGDCGQGAGAAQVRGAQGTHAAPSCVPLVDAEGHVASCMSASTTPHSRDTRFPLMGTSWTASRAHPRSGCRPEWWRAVNRRPGAAAPADTGRATRAPRRGVGPPEPPEPVELQPHAAVVGPGAGERRPGEPRGCGPEPERSPRPPLDIPRRGRGGVSYLTPGIADWLGCDGTRPHPGG